MIVDSSAIVAIFFQEPGYEVLVHKLARPGQRGIGAPTLVESGIVLNARLGQDLRGTLARFIEETGLAVVPFTEAHYGIALGAWVKFGKGRPAILNVEGKGHRRGG
jgi:ribonuclease VapC